jgi:Arc/MetJ family transcription regulator
MNHAAGRVGSAGPLTPRCIYCYFASYIFLLGACPMTKRLIDLDDELLAEAQRELNTTGISDTVRAALQQAASAAARARQVRWLREGGLEPMADSAQRVDVWR